MHHYNVIVANCFIWVQCFCDGFSDGLRDGRVVMESYSTHKSRTQEAKAGGVFTFGGSGTKDGGGLGSCSTSLLLARFMRGTGAGLCRKGGGGKGVGSKDGFKH